MMKNKILSSFFLVVLMPAVVLAAEEHAAAHGGHHSPTLDTLIWPAINFAIYLFIMSYFYRKLGRPALLGKAVSVKEQLQRGALALSSAQQDLADLERRDIAQEKRELNNKIMNDGKMLAASVIEEANATASKIARDVELRINRDFIKVEDEFKTEVVKKASEMVRKEFSANLTDIQDKELRKDALRSVLN